MIKTHRVAEGPRLYPFFSRLGVSVAQALTMSPVHLLYPLREGYETQTLSIASIFSAETQGSSVFVSTCPRDLTLTQGTTPEVVQLQAVQLLALSLAS
jgi:hypothetical protein